MKYNIEKINEIGKMLAEVIEYKNHELKAIIELASFHAPKELENKFVSAPNRWGGSSTAAQTQRLSQHFGALT